MDVLITLHGVIRLILHIKMIRISLRNLTEINFCRDRKIIYPYFLWNIPTKDCYRFINMCPLMEIYKTYIAQNIPNVNDNRANMRENWNFTLCHAHAPRSYVCHSIAIRELKLELSSGILKSEPNRRQFFRPVWPWNLTDDLEKNRAPLLWYL